jgi:hypothetical protein
MKNLFFLTLFLSSSILSAKSTRASGYYIKRNSKDTVRTEFEVKLDKEENVNYHDMQDHITCFSGEEKTKLSASDILEVSFQYKGKRYRMYGLNITFNIVGSGKNFLFTELRVDGKLKAVVFWGKIEDPAWAGTPQINDAGTGLYLQKKEWIILTGDQKRNFVCHDDNSFWPLIEAYFDDCPAHLKKIKDREWGINEPDRMAEGYNLTCK